MMTASTDADAARRLVDRHVTDPRRREQAHQAIDNAPRGVQSPMLGVGTFPGATIISPTGLPPTMMLGPNGQPIVLRPPTAGAVPGLSPAGAAPLVLGPPPMRVPPDTTRDQ